jgi:hypothetical protein
MKRAKFRGDICHVMIRFAEGRYLQDNRGAELLRGKLILSTSGMREEDIK